MAFTNVGVVVVVVVVVKTVSRRSNQPIFSFTVHGLNILKYIYWYKMNGVTSSVAANIHHACMTHHLIDRFIIIIIVSLLIYRHSSLYIKT